MGYKSVREILNSVFNSSDSTLRGINKTDGEILNMVLDESGDPALKVNIEGSSGLSEVDKVSIAKTFYNALINPLDENGIIDQRGVGSTSVSNAFVADRWRIFAVSEASTFAAEIKQSTENKYYLELSGGIANGGGNDEHCGFYQRIENVRTLAGETAVLSFDIESESGGTMIVAGTQSFGSGGSNSLPLSNYILNIPAGKTRISQLVTIPSTAGKVVGDNSFLDIYVTKQAGASSYYGECNTLGTVKISNIKLGYNDIYVPIDPATELVKCHRYCQTVGTIGAYTEYQGGFFSSTGFDCDVLLPTRMRAAPLIEVYDTSDGAPGKVQAFFAGSWKTALYAYADKISADRFNIRGTYTTGYTMGLGCQVSFKYIATSEL